MLFSIVASPIYIPTSCAQGLLFLHVLTNTYYLLSFLIITNLSGTKWYPIMVLIRISQMISDVEHLFMYLLPSCMSSLGKCLFRFSVHFYIMLSVFFFIELYELLTY